MRRVIVGTAGHIDHGKTKLVEALTGIDCDRWAEEKQRGITIDLGFAFLHEGDLQVGFIDVPGHERFVHNALAGLGGIRVALLVVAADEGVKPQTREHLDICRLLAIPGCLVALTKIDLVSEDLRELARLEIEELLSPTPFAAAPILPVSSKTGEGVAGLRQRLIELAEQHQAPYDADRPARIPIDRAFHLKGLGVVVTGTLISGAVGTGDSLELLPSHASVRIRSLQVHGSERQVAEAGERTALQLSGAHLQQLHRGAQLTAHGRFSTSTTLMAQFALLENAPKPLKGSTLVRFHLYSREQLGRLRPLQGALAPGRSGAVEIRLAQPVVAVRGDRFIVRRPSPALTLGGGEILDPDWRRASGRRLDPSLKALSGSLPAALAFWVGEAKEAGTDSNALGRKLGIRPQAVESQLDDLAREQQVLRAPTASAQPTRWLAPEAFRRVASRASEVLDGYFRRQRLAGGMPKAEVVEQILPRAARDLADVYLQWLQAERLLEVSGDVINLPGRSAKLTTEESRLATDIVSQFEAAELQPPAPSQVRATLGAKPQIFEGVVRYLLEQRRLTRLPGGLLISSSALGKVIEELDSSDQDSFSVGDFKKRHRLTRKWAIPILEHLDSVGVTRRIGDRRQVIRRRP